MQRTSHLFFGICLSSFFTALPFQPYLDFAPAPQPEIGLNASSNSIFFVDATTTVYSHMAHECFLDNIRERDQLSALYFNSSNFRLSHAFQDCMVPTSTENYNPYMRILRFTPNVSFTEIGTSLGLRAEVGMGSQKWFHLGIKASLPFKRREIARNDKGARGQAERQDIRAQAEVAISDINNSIPDARAYRLDFLEALPNIADFSESIQYDAGNANTSSTSFFSSRVSVNNTQVGGALILKEEGSIPRNDNIAIYKAALGETNSQVSANLPRDLRQMVPGAVYQIPEDGIDYITPYLDSTAKTVQKRIADQDLKAKIWLIGGYETDASTDEYNDLTTLVEEKLDQYNENTFEWFNAQGIEIESQLCQGIGDLRVESYLAADLFDTFQIRLSGGCVLPTARQQTTGKSPYAIHLGNRGHLECFVAGGLTLAVPHTSWFVTSDAQYTTALNAMENIAATARGAQVKNIGPETRAYISWHDARGNVWLHMQHPNTDALGFSLGYDWYVKIEDTLRFSSAPLNSALGNIFNTTTRRFDRPNPLTLDPEVAKNHTGAVRHALRMAASYTPSPYLKISAQVGYVLAGRNTPQTVECSLGCIIRF